MLSSQASCVIVSGFRAAMDLDTYPHWNLIRPRCAEWAKPGQGLKVSQCSLCILAFSLVFTPYLSNAVVSAKSPHYFLALVALKLLVSLISRLVACSARIVVDRHTHADRQTHRRTTVTLAAHARRGLMSTGLPRPRLARSAHRGRMKLLRGYVSKSSAVLNRLTITQLASQ